MTARGAWAVRSFPTRPLLGNCPTKGGYLNRALAIPPITCFLDDSSSSYFPSSFPCSRILTPAFVMSSTDESVHYIGESWGDDPSEATSRRSGSSLPSYIAGRRCSLRQAVRRLLDESSEEEDVGEEEGSSPREWESLPREERVVSGNREGRYEASAWVACGLRQSDIYRLVEEFAIPPEYVISLPPPDSYPSSPLRGI
ncbi:UNVERIFIED_CONTAM: hypothetical protein Slati_2186900 [Sesamum latifolium]|uniref:Uncharacterized protein n=1 Tax=Sesamum latifolium TaxID=2727402 RepID=A0AAW2WS04_9LAMI